MIQKRKKPDRQQRLYLSNLTGAVLLLLALCFITNSGLLGRAAMLFYGPGSRSLFGTQTLSQELFQAVFVYGRDFLCGYALFFALAFLFRDSAEKLFRALELALLFEAGLELVLYLAEPALCFSLKNVASQAFGSALAFLLILLFERKLI